jgi:hypothetical protein
MVIGRVAPLLRAQFRGFLSVNHQNLSSFIWSVADLLRGDYRQLADALQGDRDAVMDALAAHTTMSK